VDIDNHCIGATLALEMADDELNPTQWAGVVAFLVLLTVPIAVALAVWCKRRYALAVTRLQRGATSAAPPAPMLRVVAATPPRPLHLELRDAAAADAPPDVLRAGLRVRRRVLAAQFVLATGYWWALLLALIVALAYLSTVIGSGADEDTQTNPWGHLLLWPLLFVPPLLGWAFQAGLRESRVWAAFAAALAAMVAGLVAMDTGWVASLAAVAVAGLLALMLSAFMRPAVRGAGPPLMLAIITTLLVLFVLMAVIAALDDSPDEALTTFDWALGLGAMLLLLAVGVAVAWALLTRMARRYAAKRYSELQLAHDAYWSLVTAFALGFVLMLSFEGRTQRSMEWVALAVALVWIVWRLVLKLALRWATRRAAPHGPALLLLRVFKPSQRSEGFADRLLARWRFVGPVWLIAGPDLAGAFMEPDEFFAWLRRRLHEHFVADPAQVNERIAALDNRRDPDGRFRTSELFCADNTWRDVVLALIEHADVVLLDLREFTPQRAGTHFELVQLLRRAPLAKVLVLVDARDELAPLQAAIHQAWAEAQRPLGASDPAPSLTLLRIGAGSDSELRGLAQAAARAATR
jgi:hypothetical protein